MPNCFQFDPHTPDRLALADRLHERNLRGTAVEVGVWRGDFAEPFYRRWGGARMFLVDPWAKLDGYDDIRNEDFDPADLDHVRERMAKYGGRVMPLRMTSGRAAGMFDEGAVDFVYVDANHAYEAVAADLRLWWPKVRPGGILAGHDLFVMNHPGVTAAVAEFCAEGSLVCRGVMGDFDGNGQLVNAHSWYVEKF